VYFRVRDGARDGGRGTLPALHADSLVRKLAIKPDTALYDWLERELAHRFDLACCVDAAQFRRESRAITRNGQIKAPGERHEKDDRHRLDDRARYVLGWSNAAKIAALEGRARAEAERLGALGSHIGTLIAEQQAVRQRLDALGKLDEYRDFVTSTGSRWRWRSPACTMRSAHSKPPPTCCARSTSASRPCSRRWPNWTNGSTRARATAPKSSSG